MNLRIILMCSLFFAGSSNAGEWCNSIALQINGISKHLSGGLKRKKDEFRDNNPGFGLVCQNNQSDWMAGKYKNSVYRESFYIFNNQYLRFGKEHHVDIGLAYGLATGYTEQMRLPNIGGDISVLGFITASTGSSDLGKLNILWLPKTVIAINLDIRID